MNTPQRKPLTTKQAKAVKAKVDAELKGQSQQVAAQQVFPNQTPEAAAVSMTRTLKKANVQDALAEAFAKHGITIDAATKPVADGLQATKEDGDIDHATRLKASGMAFKLMGIGQQSGDVTINFINQAAEQREIYDL